MKQFHTIARTCITLVITIFIGTAYAQEIAGNNEMVTILPGDLHLKAKLDTGAKNSSLDARDIEYFTKDKEKWVRFKVVRAEDKKEHTLEYPLEDTVRIISRTNAEHNADERPYHRRPVIVMDLCIGHVVEKVEVNLTNRANFSFPFLLGETALAQFNLLVDVKKDYSLAPECHAKP